MNSLSPLTPQLLRRAADVQEHILKLQDELTSILATITSPEAAEEPKREVSDAAEAKMRPAPPQAEKPVTSKKPAAGKTGMPFKEAIFKALASREPMHKNLIAAKVAQLRGEKPNPVTIKGALRELKKD